MGGPVSGVFIGGQRLNSVRFLHVIGQCDIFWGGDSYIVAVFCALAGNYDGTVQSVCNNDVGESVLRAVDQRNGVVIPVLYAD